MTLTDILLGIIILLLLAPYLYKLLHKTPADKFNNLFSKDLSEIDPEHFIKHEGTVWPKEMVKKREEAIAKLEQDKEKK